MDRDVESPRREPPALPTRPPSIHGGSSSRPISPGRELPTQGDPSRGRRDDVEPEGRGRQDLDLLPPGRHPGPGAAASCWWTTTPRASPHAGVLGAVGARQLDPAETIAARLRRATSPSPSRSSGRRASPGIDLVPGSLRATRHNVPVPHEADWPSPGLPPGVPRRGPRRLRPGPDRLPPNLHLCSLGGAGRQRRPAVPLQPEDYGAQGLADVRESVARGPGRAEPGAQPARLPAHDGQPPPDGPPALRGAAPGALRRRRLRRQVPEAADFVEAIAQRKPIASYKPQGGRGQGDQGAWPTSLARPARRRRTGPRQEAA